MCPWGPAHLFRGALPVNPQAESSQRRRLMNPGSGFWPQSGPRGLAAPGLLSQERLRRGGVAAPRFSPTLP